MSANEATDRLLDPVATPMLHDATQLLHQILVVMGADEPVHRDIVPRGSEDGALTTDDA